jgi:tRNA dimethylallyltransferase
LLAKGYSPRLKSLQTIGYRECIQYLQGEISLDEALSLIQRATRHYAKRQLTWFRKDDSIIWVDSCQESVRILALIDQFYAA